MSLLLSVLLLLLSPSVVTDSLRAVSNRCEEAYLANRPELMPPLMARQEALIAQLGPADSLLARYAQAHLEKQQGSYWFCLSEEDLSLLEKARQYYLAARQHYPAQFDVTPFAQHTVSLELAQLYYRQKNYTAALEELRPLVNSSFSRRLQTEALGPYALCLARTGRFSAARKAIGRLPSDDPEALRKEAKILALEAEAAGKQSLEAVALYRRYFQAVLDEWPSRLEGMSEEDREAFWMRMRPFATDCIRTEAADPAFLYDVVLFTKELMFQLRTTGAFVPCTWQQVQKALGKKEAAVEFVCYEACGEQRLAALVLRKTGKPVFVPLGSETALLQEPLAPGVTIAAMLSGENSRITNLGYSSPKLGGLIWSDALRAALKGATDVFFSPDGFLHVLGVEHCYPAAEAPVLHRVSGTRVVTRRGLVASAGARKALLVGDVDFDAAPSASASANDDEAYRCLTRARVRFGALPHTRAELDSVQAILGGGCSVLSGKQAREDAVTDLAGYANLIHLSTHGYFSGVPYFPGDELKAARLDHSLSRSVLLLSGGNRILRDPSFDAAGHPDGLLSAREVSRLRLQGSPLVVMAACQSGLGVISADGMSGLQAGWKMAGAGALVASLWSVSDEATAFFMETFYRELAGGASARQAFDHARARLREPVAQDTYRYDIVRLKYVPFVQMKDWSAPQYVDAFILIDDCL